MRCELFFDDRMFMNYYALIVFVFIEHLTFLSA